EYRNTGKNDSNKLINYAHFDHPEFFFFCLRFFIFLWAPSAMFSTLQLSDAVSFIRFGNEFEPRKPEFSRWQFWGGGRGRLDLRKNYRDLNNRKSEITITPVRFFFNCIVRRMQQLGWKVMLKERCP
uniref:Uncharacterized protein n=1 Tax=Parascaris univalens TaxID=6257 RepID=A0A915B5F6_PARUN